MILTSMTETRRFDMALRHYSPTRLGRALNKTRLGRWLGWAKDCWTVHQFDNVQGHWTLNDMQTSEDNEIELAFGTPAVALSAKARISYHLQGDNHVAVVVSSAEGMKQYMISPDGTTEVTTPENDRSIVTHAGPPQLRLYRAG